ncbi:hypothetical protein AGLY_001527 [Aphis glycines]|uniref:Potassium channel domain-containing protein n=1 Tax=Aphis glycines TaxID=307491 RepID=A0A6G0U5F7_APHGL|nr:hypothetical protein AGLY_001527 [Aphis glycines]
MLYARNRREKSSKKSSSTVGTGSVQHTPPSPQQYNTSHNQRAELSPKSRKQQIGGNGGKPVYRLTSEAKHVLCECAEYQLANSPTHDHVAAHILRQLGDRPNLPTTAAKHEEYAYDDGVGDDDNSEDCYHQMYSGAHGTPSRLPLLSGNNRQQQRRRGDKDRRHNAAATASEHYRREVAAAAAAAAAAAVAATNSKRPNKRRNGAPPGVPVALVLLVLAGYICLGAAVFAAWEGWTFIDGAYFCFVTLSTIGFGDLVPGKSFQGTDTQNGQLQLVACCGYLLFGLVLIAMSFSLVQEEVVSKCRHAARYVGLLKQPPRPGTQPYAL